MEEFWFYIKLGLDHVLDFSAYDHILFLTALALPFTFKSWKKVVLLATLFTISHCLSLTVSVYKIIEINASLIEFLIPLTILFTALFNLFSVVLKKGSLHFGLHLLATTFFGLIHGFGFSNYFKMLMAGEEEKLLPLLGFATGIEISQILIILFVLIFIYLAKSIFQIKQYILVVVISLLIIGIVIPMLIKALS